MSYILTLNVCRIGMLLILYIQCMVNTMNNNDSGDLFPKYNFLARTEPAVIRNLTVSEITTSSVFLSWIEPLGNSSFYRVEWTGGSRDMNTTSNETAFNVTELTAGVQYTCRILAINGDEMTEGKNISVSLFTSKMKFTLSGLYFLTASCNILYLIFLSCGTLGINGHFSCLEADPSLWAVYIVAVKGPV